MAVNGEVAEKCTLQRLLSSTPTPQTWKIARGLIVDSDITWRGDSGETLLHLVPSCAQTSSYVDYLLPVVYQLADAGVDVDAVDIDGNTALHVCAMCHAGHRMAAALARIGVVADSRNNAGQTPADIARQLDQQSVVAVLNEAASGLWAAVRDSNQETISRLIELLWFRVDLRRDGKSLLATARGRLSDSLMRTLTERSQYVRLMHTALSGGVDEVRHQLQYCDCRAVAHQLRDARYRLDDGTITEWPLLAQVLQLRLTDVARVLMEFAGCDVNESIAVDGGRRIPLFQWAVDPVVQSDIAIFEVILERADVSLIVDPVVQSDIAIFEVILDRADVSLIVDPVVQSDIAILELILDRADVSLIVDPVVQSDIAIFEVILERADVSLIVDPVVQSDIAIFEVILDRADVSLIVDAVVQSDIAVFELILDRADVSLIVDPAEFVYSLWQQRHPALLFDRFAARDLSLVSMRDHRGRTIRDRVLLDSLEYGATDVMKIGVLYVDEFVLNLVTTGKVSCLERLMMSGYENINVFDRAGKSASKLAADAKVSSVVDFLDKLPHFQVSS